MAADLTQSFMGKHVEKVVLAAAVVIFIASITQFVVLREPQDRLLDETARAVKNVKERVDKPTLKDALDQD